MYRFATYPWGNVADSYVENPVSGMRSHSASHRVSDLSARLVARRTVANRVSGTDRGQTTDPDLLRSAARIITFSRIQPNMCTNERILAVSSLWRQNTFSLVHFLVDTYNSVHTGARDRTRMRPLPPRQAPYGGIAVPSCVSHSVLA